MGKLNTIFNGASAHYNRRTAQAVTRMAVADRHRDLRARDLISDRSTAAEIAAVERRLELQMRARDALAQTGKARNPQGRLVALAGVVAVLAAVFARRAELTGGATFLVFVLAAAVVLAVGIPIVRRQETARAETVERADWRTDGTCGWCGSRDDHLVDGEAEHPLVAHAVEVQAEIERG